MTQNSIKTVSMEEDQDTPQRGSAETNSEITPGISLMAQISHDLRTPVNAMMGYSMLIEKFSYDRERVSQYARRSFLSGQIMMELINNTLDMGCVEGDEINLIETEFSLMSVLNDIQISIMPITECKKQDFNFYINNPHGVDRVTGDKSRMYRILQNVISNAVKYTSEEGRIDVYAELKKDTSGNVQMSCQIRDTGCGMSKEFIEDMFKPYERERNALIPDVPGLGLGMCIARTFTELMGGELSVESELGVGTVVTVRIPLKISQG